MPLFLRLLLVSLRWFRDKCWDSFFLVSVCKMVEILCSGMVWIIQDGNHHIWVICYLASAAKHWCMHGVFLKSGVIACVEVISRSPTWPSVQAGCPVWQQEIISIISLFASATHKTAKTDNSVHTHQRQRHQTHVWLHIHKLTHVCTDGYTHTDTYTLGQYPSISPALQPKATFCTTHVLFIFLSKTRSPASRPFLQAKACRPENVHKVGFRQ